MNFTLLPLLVAALATYFERLSSKHIFISSMLAALLFFVAPNVRSENSIKIGSMENYAPYNFVDANGNYTGIDVEIVNAVLADLDLKPTHLPRPWKRAVAEFENGFTDMLFQLSPSPERFSKWIMVGPIRSNNRGYFVRHDSEIQDIAKLHELDGLKVGTIDGYIYPEEFTAAGYFTKEAVSYIKQNVKKLIAGRIDIVVENEFPFMYEVERLGVKAQIRQLPTLASKGERYVAFRKDKQGRLLAEMFQKKLDELIAKGRIQEILDTWY